MDDCVTADMFQLAYAEQNKRLKCAMLWKLCLSMIVCVGVLLLGFICMKINRTNDIMECIVKW